jgi:hypothetical protein
MPEHDKMDADNQPKSGKDQKGSQRGLWLIIAAGFVAVVAVIFVGSFWISLVDRTRFITEFILTVALADLVAVQAYIYKKQWQAMDENIARTDVVISKMGQQQATMEWQAEIAEIQTRLVEQQVGAMKEQLEAMRGQLDAMKEQATIMRETLAQNQKQIEMSETRERGYMGIGDMILSNLVVGGRPIVTIKWVNGGRTPVRNFRAIPFIVFGEKPISNKFHFIDDDFSAISGSFFPVGAEREVKYEVSDVINAEDWAKFERGKVQLFILGNFVYRDINGTQQVEAISAMYDRFEGHVYETYQYADAEHSKKFVQPT